MYWHRICKTIDKWSFGQNTSFVFLCSILFTQSACMYLGEIEEIPNTFPLEIFMSYPQEGSTLTLTQNPTTNKAFVYVYYSDALSNINFKWQIGPEILSSEFIPPDGSAVGSEVSFSDIDSNWDGRELFVFVFDSGSSVSRSWPIEIVEGN